MAPSELDAIEAQTASVSTKTPEQQFQPHVLHLLLDLGLSLSPFPSSCLARCLILSLFLSLSSNFPFCPSFIRKHHAYSDCRGCCHVPFLSAVPLPLPLLSLSSCFSSLASPSTLSITSSAVIFYASSIVLDCRLLLVLAYFHHAATAILGTSAATQRPNACPKRPCRPLPAYTSTQILQFSSDLWCVCLCACGTRSDSVGEVANAFAHYPFLSSSRPPHRLARLPVLRNGAFLLRDEYEYGVASPTSLDVLALVILEYYDTRDDDPPLTLVAIFFFALIPILFCTSLDTSKRLDAGRLG